MVFPTPGTLLLVVVLCGILCGLAFLRRILTREGAIAAFVVGMIIGVFGDSSWLLLLILFLGSSFLATRYRFRLKEQLGVQEGERGERGASNVLANGVAPCLAAVLGFSEVGLLPKDLSGLLFVSAIAVAGADTLASEIGVLSSRTYLITTMRPVETGRNGGISLLGQGAAAAAAVFTSVVGWLLLAFLPPRFGQAVTLPLNGWVLFIPLLVGFVGCQLDSLFGATLEERGILNKKTNNFVSTLLGLVLAYGMYFALF